MSFVRATNEALMNRRACLLALVAGATADATRAQGPEGTKLRRIGVLLPGITPDRIDMSLPDGLRAGLAELGWVDGRNLVIEVRIADGTVARLVELAGELKAARADAIVAPGTIAIKAARDGAPGIPIVMASGGDPIGAGLVETLAHPGGNVTGLSLAGREVLDKSLELLRDAVPGLQRAAILMNVANAANDFYFSGLAAAAKALGLQLVRIEVEGVATLDSAIARARGGGLLVLREPLFFGSRERLARLAVAARVPAMYSDRRFVAAGGLMSYGAPSFDVARGAARYVDRS